MRIAKHDERLNTLLREFRPPVPSRANGHASPPLSDADVLKLARGEGSGKFERLWNGDLSEYGGDHSAADNAFVWKLYFYTQDDDQIRRIHASSKLARDKSLDRPEYLQYSIDNARATLSDLYSPRDSHSHSLSSNVSEGTHDKVTDLEQSIKAITLRGRDKPAPRGWIVANQIWEHHAACWYGEGGVAKSLLAMHLATHVASPSFTEWLGTPIKTAPVLCLDFELDAEEQHRRLYEIARGLGLEDVPANIYYLGATEHPPAVMFAAAAREVERLEVKLAIVDSVGFAVEGDAEVARDILSFHRKYLEPIKAAGASPLLIDHQAKIVKGEKYSDKTAFGSVYKTNAVRSMFQVRGGKSDDGMTATFRHTKNNFGPKGDEFSVDVAFKLGKITVTALEDVVPDPSREPTMEDRILEALNLEELTSAEIADTLGEKRTSVANAVARLKGDGKVEETGEKRDRAHVLRVPSLTLPISECECESREEVPLSAKLAPGQSATLAELRAGDSPKVEPPARGCDTSSPSEFDEMRIHPKINIRAWVRENIVPCEEEHSSYYLKHVAEDELGTYTSNGEMRGAMMEAGFLPAAFQGPNALYKAAPRDELERHFAEEAFFLLEGLQMWAYRTRRHFFPKDKE